MMLRHLKAGPPADVTDVGGRSPSPPGGEWQHTAWVTCAVHICGNASSKCDSRLSVVTPNTVEVPCRRHLRKSRTPAAVDRVLGRLLLLLDGVVKPFFQHSTQCDTIS